MLGPPETQNPPVMAVTEGPDVQSGGDRLGNKNSTKNAGEYSRNRYTAHSHIRRILIAQAMKERPGTHPGNVYRTAACTWVPVADPSMVRPANRESWHYKGLATCGSVWACPLCASKIQERRRGEVAAAIVYGKGVGKAPAMLSFTFPHRVDQPLSLLLELQGQAFKKLRESRGYVSIMLKVGLAGRIRALEVTHGQNGWHPHTHELVFVDQAMPAAWLREELAPLWLKACAKVGLFRPGLDDESAFLRHSVDVQEGDAGVAGYLAKLDDQSKWSLAHEVTKGASKQGRRAGSHPFALAMQTPTAALFVEYVQAMKGQRQLVWSRGLKAAVGVVEKSDEELAQEETAIAADQIALTRSKWRVVLGNDARWELTDAARTGGALAVNELLTLLGYEEPT